MAFFFGGRKRRTSTADAGPRMCRNCGRATPHRLVTSTETANLYGLESSPQVNEVLVCAVCGRSSRASKDAWLEVHRSRMKQRRFRKAMTRGRARGLGDLTSAYGARTNIDLQWISQHEREIDRIFRTALVKELTGAGLGLKEKDVTPHLPRYVLQMKGELRAYVEANPD